MAKTGNNEKFPWSIKGVSIEARNTAKALASEQGMTMGEWLTLVIRGDSVAPMISASNATGPKQTNSNDHNGIQLHPKNEQRVLAQLSQTESRVIEAIKPLNAILKQLSLRLEALESRSNQNPKNKFKNN